jgi:capsule polysaccharide export protein KpsE/RkpR
VTEKGTKFDEKRKQVATLQDQLNTATTKVENQRSSINGVTEKMAKLQAEIQNLRNERETAIQTNATTLTKVITGLDTAEMQMRPEQENVALKEARIKVLEEQLGAQEQQIARPNETQDEDLEFIE